MKTEDLIATLAQNLRPVARLPSPARQTVSWLGVTIPALALITILMGPRPDLGSKFGTQAFVIPESLGTATALISAYSAFCAGRPDHPGWKLWLPMIAMLAWLADLGQQCTSPGLHARGEVFGLHLDPACIPAIAMAGLIPAAAFVILARRSASFRRDHACLCGALASAAAAEVALRLFHGTANLVTLLLWQMGSVMLFTAIGWFISSNLLRPLATILPPTPRDANR